MSPRALQVLGILMALLAAGVVLIGQYRPVEQSAILGLAVGAAAAVAAAGTAYLALTRPWWGVVAWLALIPLINMARTEVWLGPVQVIGTTPVVLSLVVGVAVWHAGLAPAERPRVPGVAWLVLAAAVALTLAATLAAPLSVEGVNITLHGLLEPYAVFGCVLALRPDARRTVQALAALAVGIIGAALVNLAYLFGTIGPASFYDRRFLYARVTYFNVGIFSGMLVTAMVHLFVVILARARMAWPRWVAAAAWIGLGIAMVAIFFTYTKSAWVAAVVGLTLVALLLVRGWLRRAALLVAVYVLLAVVVPFPRAAVGLVSPDLADAYYDFVVSLQSEERVESWDPESVTGRGSVGIRFVALSASAELAARHPLLGVGPGRYGEVFREVRPSATVPNLNSAHNFLPNLAVEFGIPLMAIVLVGMGAAVLLALPWLDSGDQLARIAAVGVAIAIVAYNAFFGLFGLDLYRTFRTMNADVIQLAVLTALGLSMGLAWRERTVETGAGDRSP